MYNKAVAKRTYCAKPPSAESRHLVWRRFVPERHSHARNLSGHNLPIRCMKPHRSRLHIPILGTRVISPHSALATAHREHSPPPDVGSCSTTYPDLWPAPSLDH